MAGTDVQDVYVFVRPDGETWLYKRLCNGTEIAVTRLCGCEGNPDDPGDTPDPVDVEICRVANHIGRYVEDLAESLYNSMFEQPYTDIGKIAATFNFLNSNFTPWGTWQWELTLALVTEYQTSEYQPILEAGVFNLLQPLVCGAYAAIISDPNELDLSPEFVQAFKQLVIEYNGELNETDYATLPFMARVVELTGLSGYKRLVLEAATVEEHPFGDLPCDCGGDPSEDVCSGVHWQWSQIGSTPSGFTVPTGTPVSLNTAWRNFCVNPPVGGDPAIVDVQTNVVSRTPFDNWRCPLDNSAPIDSFMMLVYEFPEPCTLTQAHMRVATGTSNSKRAGIYYQLDGTSGAGAWIPYAENWINLTGGFLQTGATLTVENVARVCFCGAYGGGQLFMNETAINSGLA